MVIDGDKADTEFRTNPLQEVACLNIIAAQAGQVFYDDAVDFPGFDSLIIAWKRGRS